MPKTYFCPSKKSDLKIFDSSTTKPVLKHPVITIGTFDGVHIGHQKIIDKLNKSAKEVNGESVLFTFFPHPRQVIFPDSNGIQLIQTQEEKLQKLARFGLQNVIVYPFTKEFSRTSATHFVRDYLVNELKAHKIVIGYNHQFGKNREGSLEQLRELAPLYHFEVEEIPAQEIDEVDVSSTKIRKALENGDIITANKYLNEPFQLNGTVVHGNAIGRTLGYPTANMLIEDNEKLIPKVGIYLVRCEAKGEMYFGMLSIGYRPTIEQQTPVLTIEVAIFDFDQDIYGERICLELLEYTREELKFDSLESLRLQLVQDELHIRQLAQRYTLEQYTL